MELIGRLRAEGVRAVSPNGVLGNPEGASAAEGHALLTAASARLASYAKQACEVEGIVS